MNTITGASVLKPYYYFTARVEKEDGFYCITVPQLPGCITYTDNADQVYATTHEAIMCWFISDTCLPRPTPSTEAYVQKMPAAAAFSCKELLAGFTAYVTIALTEDDIEEIRREDLAQDRMYWI